MVQTNFGKSQSKGNDFVEGAIRISFGGIQPIIVTGKVTWTDFKYQDDGTEQFKFGLNCASGVSVRDGDKTVYPYSTHWFTILSNEASQTAKGKSDANPDKAGTNAERMAEIAVPGTYMTVIYLPQVNVDGTPRLTIRDIKEGPQTVQVAETAWGTYGGSSILAVSTLGTKEEREDQAKAFENRQANRASGATTQNNAPVQSQASDPAKSQRWTPPGKPAAAPAPETQAPAPNKPVWGRKA